MLSRNEPAAGPAAAAPPLPGPGGGSVTAASRRGPAHSQNEDRWGLLGADDMLLLAVADGMGGTAGGGTAAGIALRTLLELADARPDPADAPADPAAARPDPAAAPAARAKAPAARADAPVARANAPAARADAPVARADGPGARADGPVARVDGPVARADGPVARVDGPVARVDGPGAWVDGPAARAEAPDIPAAPTVDRSEPTAAPAGRAIAPLAGADPARTALSAAMTRAHHRVQAAAPPGLPEALRPGSTLTAALVLGDRLVVGHVGDSACWLLRRGALIRLTEVHTHAAVLVAAGAVDRGSPAARRLDNLLTRHLGMPGELRPQLTGARLEVGDRLLLATDGLSRALPPVALAALLARPDTTAGLLVGAAVAAGAKDDVTALLATIGETASGYAAAVGVAAREPSAESAQPGEVGWSELAGLDERQLAARTEEPGAQAVAGR